MERAVAIVERARDEQRPFTRAYRLADGRADDLADRGCAVCAEPRRDGTCLVEAVVDVDADSRLPATFEEPPWDIGATGVGTVIDRTPAPSTVEGVVDRGLKLVSIWVAG
jgi:hypothetical protein